MNVPNLNFNAISLPAVSDDLMTNLSNWLGITGDPQGFFFYLLIMVGIFVIISILLYNWLEERRFNKQVESNFVSIEEDALLNEDKQEFLDKFASTTGTLNDTPDEGTFVDENGEALEDDRSIEDVYSDLLETMSRRNREEKVEPSGITIDHDNIDIESEPVLNFPEAGQAATEKSMSDDILYIPDTVPDEVTNDMPAMSVPFSEPVRKEIEIEFDDPIDTPTTVPVADEISDVLIPEPVEPEVAAKAEPVGSQDIKDIINRAFKEKYNPNYKAEETAEVVDVPEVKEVGDVNESVVADEAVTNAQESQGLDDVVISEPVIPDEVDDAIAKALNTRVETDNDHIPEPTETTFKNPLENPDVALEMLKGLDDKVPEPEVSLKFEANEPEPPKPQVEVPVELPEKTYQQLLNEDKLPQNDVPETEPTSEVSQDEGNESPEEIGVDQAVSTTEKQVPFSSDFTDAIPELLNQHIDLIGTIEAKKGSNAAFILESFSSLHQQYELPSFVFMQCQQGQWLLLNDATEADINRYLEKDKPVHITASLQMADRTGPFSNNTVKRFKQSLSEIAVTMGAEVQWRDLNDPIDRAGSLDAFCIEVDKTMFFHLTNTKTPFTGTKLKGLVETQGMVLERDGSYKYYDLNTESGQKRTSPDFILFNRENHRFSEEMLRSSVIKAITMQLDIPLITPNALALDRMVVIAQSLEDGLNAQLVDDKNRPITDVHLARIREQIKSIHAAMQLRGIAPGSAHALRLFS